MAGNMRICDEYKGNINGKSRSLKVSSNRNMGERCGTVLVK